jgi:ribonuclease III
MALVPKIFSSRSTPEGEFFGAIKNILGFKPKNIAVYEEAFTHRSLNEKNSKGVPQNYERLEFLGDAMLGSVIASHLFKEVPTGDEGYLTKMRSKVVSREHLNELGRDLQLIKLLKTNIPTKQFGGNIHGNIFEALVGAIYLDRGFKYCEKFIHKRVIKPYVDIERLEGKVISYKSLFIEWCQKHKMTFKLKHFAVKLQLEDKVVGKARATSKKKAEERASKRAYYKLQVAMDKDLN